MSLIELMHIFISCLSITLTVQRSVEVPVVDKGPPLGRYFSHSLCLDCGDDLISSTTGQFILASKAPSRLCPQSPVTLPAIERRKRMHRTDEQTFYFQLETDNASTVTYGYRTPDKSAMTRDENCSHERAPLSMREAITRSCLSTLLEAAEVSAWSGNQNICQKRL